VSGGYPPYTFNPLGPVTYQSSTTQIVTIIPRNTGTQTYAGLIQDSHGQVYHPTCSVTVTP
jgi:hypothetical protein